MCNKIGRACNNPTYTTAETYNSAVHWNFHSYSMGLFSLKCYLPSLKEALSGRPALIHSCKVPNTNLWYVSYDGYYLDYAVNSWVARELIHDTRRHASQHETGFRCFGFLRRPSSVMIYTYRHYCINKGWMTDGDRSTSISTALTETQFTVEKESDGQLPFLDVLVTREEDGTISTSVYRKPTHTDQYLAFEFHHPMGHKRAAVRTLMYWAEALCSSGVNWAQEEKHVQAALEKNGYLATFVQRLRLPQPDRDEEQTPQTSVTIPYIHGLSQSIHRVLSHLDIKVAFHPFRTLRQELVHPKNLVPELQRRGVVPCDQCPQRNTGQTGRSLKQHLGEHCRALRKGNVLASAVAEHMFVSGHQMDLSKARVMDSHPPTQTQCLLESWQIQHEQAPLNREKSTLQGLYTSLLRWQWRPTCGDFACHEHLITSIDITKYNCMTSYFVYPLYLLNIPAFCSHLTFTSRDLSPSAVHPVFIQ